MYRGFPVGYLLFWETGADAGARQIGAADRPSVPRLLIVDGQQRLTSLYAVMTGAPIVREDYGQSRIRIAFRPTDATFAVTDAAVEKDPELLADISALWDPAPGQRKQVIRRYLKQLAARRELGEDEEDRLEDAIDRTFAPQKLAAFAVKENASELLNMNELLPARRVTSVLRRRFPL